MGAMRFRALIWLLLAIAVGATCASQFIGRSPLQSNLLALLPATERNPVAEEAANRLANAAGNRTIFLIGHSSDATAFAAARDFAAQLRASQGIRHVLADIPEIDFNQINDLYLPYRFNFLTDADRAALGNHEVNLAERIQNKLYAPFRFGLALSPVDDPFGFTDNWINRLPLRTLSLEPENGLLITRAMGKTWVFVAADLSGSAHNREIQGQVAASVRSAEAKLKKSHPDTELLRIGTVFYADSARSAAEQEVDRIGAVSLAGMLLLLYLVFRSLRPLGLGLLTVGFGIGTAVIVTIAVYGEIHLITLVFGASLIGEAIDYAVQYFAAHLGAGDKWQPMAGLRRITPGLMIALLTSLLGYAALSLAPFPALSQIALFALVGLSAACLSVFLLLPALLTRPSKRDPEKAVALLQRILLKWQNNISPRLCLTLAAAMLVIAIPGWLQLKADDDIHLLLAREPGLAAQEQKIRSIIGFDNSSQFFLVEGKSPDEVLRNEEKLTARLDGLIAEEQLNAYQSTSAFVPSQARQIENHALWKTRIFADEAGLIALLSDAGLRNEVATDQITTFTSSANRIMSVEDWLRTPLSTPFRHLWLNQTANGYASIVIPQGARNIQLLEQSTADLQAVTFVDKVHSVTALFQQYRQWSATWLLFATGIIYAVLWTRYRSRQAAIILMPTVLAMLVTLSVLGYLNSPLTLFNMMGLMLVLGVGINYAIFLREGGAHAAATLAGVMLSAGTTLLSFGMLAFSSMPALSSFGLTLLIGVGISAMLAPMLLSFDANLDKRVST